MRRRKADFNFWPSVADTMLVAFIIVLGLWFGHQSLTKLESAKGTGGITITGDEKKEFDRLKKRNPDLEREIVLLRSENAKLRTDIRLKEEELARAVSLIQELRDALVKAKERASELEGQVTRLKKEFGTLEEALAKARKVNDKPPIISLPETSGYKFDSGTAKLSADFSLLLEKTVFTDITKVLERGDVNTIEIIGHTDGTSVRGREASNLDAQLGNVLSGLLPASALKPGSNSDLGLIRAVAVRREIEAWLKTKSLAGKISIRCYSAANSVPLTTGLATPSVFAGEEAGRRRIEIRFTQLEQVSSIIPSP